MSQLDPAQLTARDVAEAARANDRLALDVFDKAGRLLGFAVANLISLFDPEVLILGGGIGDAADLYIESLRNAMLERAQPLAARRVKIVVSRLGAKANLLGCAHLAWKSLISRASRAAR